RIGSLCVAAPSFRFVFVKALFEFIEFGWMDVQTKTKNVSVPTLTPVLLYRDLFRCARIKNSVTEA
ncbi:MAG: hypothetical protein ABI604_20795, partial [Nitrospirota bacterium]